MRERRIEKFFETVNELCFIAAVGTVIVTWKIEKIWIYFEHEAVCGGVNALVPRYFQVRIGFTTAPQLHTWVSVQSSRKYFAKLRTMGMTKSASYFSPQLLPDESIAFGISRTSIDVPDWVETHWILIPSRTFDANQWRSTLCAGQIGYALVYPDESSQEKDQGLKIPNSCYSILRGIF